MQKYLLQLKNISEPVSVIYAELLEVIDFTSSGLNEKQISYLKAQLPTTHTAFLVWLEASAVVASVTKADVTISFEQFWQRYGKKINRKRCEPLWNKLNAPKQFAAYKGIAEYEKYLKRESWRSKLDPENYLRNEVWENSY